MYSTLDCLPEFTPSNDLLVLCHLTTHDHTIVLRTMPNVLLQW